MERNTGTPVIDGGIVNAPPNFTATYNFAENQPHSGEDAGAAGPSIYNERTGTTGKHNMGFAVEPSGVGPASK